MKHEGGTGFFNTPAVMLGNNTEMPLSHGKL